MDKDKQNEKKRNLKLVDRYDNDDYSRFSEQDFSDEEFEIGESDFEHSAHQDKHNIRVRPEGNWSHPGVSGKAENGENWLNNNEYKKQANFIGYGPKGYKRSDDRIYEEVCETLMKHRQVDASNIGVKVESGIVYLSGKIESRRAKKIAEHIVEDLPGVQDVRNELMIIAPNRNGKGFDSATKKDLGIN